MHVAQVLPCGAGARGQVEKRDVLQRPCISRAAADANASTAAVYLRSVLALTASITHTQRLDSPYILTSCSHQLLLPPLSMLAPILVASHSSLVH